MLWIAQILILARVVVSFVPPWQRQPVGIAVTTLTEPMLLPFRKMTRMQAGGVGIDFSPMVVLLIISVLRRIIPG